MQTTLEIVNLKCNGCVNTVTKGLLDVEGIDKVDVDLENSQVTVFSDSAELIQKVKEKLSKMGYPEINDANTLLHKAKSFVGCASGRLSPNEK